MGWNASTNVNDIFLTCNLHIHAQSMEYAWLWLFLLPFLLELDALI